MGERTNQVQAPPELANQNELKESIISKDAAKFHTYLNINGKDEKTEPTDYYFGENAH